VQNWYHCYLIYTHMLSVSSLIERQENMTGPPRDQVIRKKWVGKFKKMIAILVSCCVMDWVAAVINIYYSLTDHVSPTYIGICNRAIWAHIMMLPVLFIFCEISSSTRLC
jgi:hypothetical protein